LISAGSVGRHCRLAWKCWVTTRK